jgi:hypothetical protein
MLPLFGALVFIAVLVVALVVDIALLQGTFRRMASSADRIAEGAAAMIDVEHLRDEGAVVLEAAEAISMASSLAVAEGMSGDHMTVEIDDGRICVELRGRYDVVALRIITGEPVAVTVRSCAEPAVG